MVSPPAPAPERPLPPSNLYSVEFPGYISPSPSSTQSAITHLGGQKSLERAFRRNANKVDSILELSWRPDDPFAHKIPGDVAHTSNILLKVTKRRRRKVRVEEGEGEVGPSRVKDSDSDVGEFTVEPVGVINRTVRFRGMADFQYRLDESDPVVQLRAAMDRMDVDFLKNYVIPPEKEDYTVPLTDPPSTSTSTEDPPSNPIRSNLRMFPPPVFSRQNLFQNYHFRPSNMSVVTTVIDEKTGLEKKRLINKSRWKGYGPATISFSENSVPTAPPQNIAGMKDLADKKLYDTLQQMFQDRPSWTRTALHNSFSPPEVREITNSKVLIPLVCYVFQDGPWRDTLLRFGYDPRTDASGRFYQRLYFRNLNHPIVRPSVTARRQESRIHNVQAPRSSDRDDDVEGEPSAAPPPSHIFDGVHVTTETAAFQLCDIHDPMLKEMIEDESGLRDVCNERDGWYTTHALEQIKTVLRHKFFSLLDGHRATDEECRALLEQKPESVRTPLDMKPRRKPRKHNMAKGALPPEDAVAARLRATLDKERGRIAGDGR